MRKILLDLAPGILLNALLFGALFAACTIAKLGAGAQFWTTGGW
jgi:hypothetical protein